MTSCEMSWVHSNFNVWAHRCPMRWANRFNAILKWRAIQHSACSRSNRIKLLHSTSWRLERWTRKGFLHNPKTKIMNYFTSPASIHAFIQPEFLLLKRDVMKFERSLNRLTMMNAKYNFPSRSLSKNIFSIHCYSEQLETISTASTRFML